MTRNSSLVLALVWGAGMLLGSAALQAGDVKAGPPAPQGEQKPLVRMLKGLSAEGFGERPTEITTKEQFVKIFGAKAVAQVADQVDFSKEKILWVTWAGSSSSWLTFSVRNDQGKITVVVSIQKSNPAFADYRLHGGLIVMPKDASWEFGKVKVGQIQ
jgi:hypothetical protein